MRALAALMALIVAAPAAWAGKLDLNIYTPSPMASRGAKEPGYQPRFEWTPGSPLNLRGEGPATQALSHAGYTTMAVWGFTQSLQGLGRDRDATATAVGFGLVSALTLWGDWVFWKDARRRQRPSEVEFFFLPSTRR